MENNVIRKEGWTKLSEKGASNPRLRALRSTTQSDWSLKNFAYFLIDFADF